MARFIHEVVIRNYPIASDTIKRGFAGVTSGKFVKNVDVIWHILALNSVTL